MLKSKLLIVFLLLFISKPLFSQVEIDLIDRGLGDYQQLFVGDFDFLQLGSSEDLFAIVIRINENRAITADMLINLYKGEGADEELIATLSTNTFTIPNPAGPGGRPVWTISNIDLINETFNFDNAQNGQIDVSSEIAETAETLEKEMRETSQLPVGIYRLKAIIQFDNKTASDEAEQIIIVNITNPYLLSQITPGDVLNSGFVYELFTQNPIFQWSGNSGDYEVVVFKKQNEFSTPDDILNSQPVWESGHLDALFARYPDEGAVPLEYGSNYIWQVRSFIQTSSGVNVIESELWEFRLVDPSQTNTSREAMAKQELEILLKQLLGTRADAIIREISKFDLTTIRVNGSILTVPELYQLIESYRNQKKEIFDLTLRSSN